MQHLGVRPMANQCLVYMYVQSSLERLTERGILAVENLCPCRFKMSYSGINLGSIAKKFTL